MTKVNGILGCERGCFLAWLWKSYYRSPNRQCPAEEYSEKPKGRGRESRHSKDTPKTTFADVAGVSEAVEELEEIKEKLIPYLEEKFDGLGVEMCYVMLTNIVKEDTELLCFGEKAREVILSAFQLPSDMEDIVLKGLVSRKKQLIPSIVTVLQQM